MDAQPGSSSFNYEEELAEFVRVLTLKFGESWDTIEEAQDFNDGDGASASIKEEELLDPDQGGDFPRELPGEVQIPRVRFDETAKNSKQRRINAPKCEDFMEQTISVPEIEKIFDIDFDKDWITIVSSYQASQSRSEPRTKEQRKLEKKIRKAEKLLRKRDEKIRFLVQRAKTPSEAEMIRRQVLEKMRIKAEKYIEKRKRQSRKEELKERKNKEAELTKVAELDRGDH